MMPAAILSVLVKTDGAQRAAAQLSALDTVAKKTSGSMDAAAAASNRAAASQGRLAGAASKSRAGLAAAARPAGFVAVGIAAVGAASVKTAAQYETSMNTLKAVSGATNEEMKKLSDTAVQLGADVKLPGTSAQDAAEAMTEMIKAGVSTKDTMDGVRSTLVLSAAAGIDNAGAAKIAANAMNIFRLRGKDVAEVTDQLANTANASSVEITDVADSMKMAGAVFNAFQSPVLGAKGAMKELNVAIGLLGNAGIRGSDAGTSLKQTLLQLTAPSDKAKGAMFALYGAAKKANGAEAATTAVMSGTAKERRAALGDLEKLNPALKNGGDIAFTAAGKMRSLKDIIKLVSQGTKGMTDEQKDWYISQIFGADAVRSVTVLMKAQGKQWDTMDQKVGKAGAAQDLANAKMKGLKGAFDALKSSVETLAIVFGLVLLPLITPLVRGFTDLLNAIDPKVLGIAAGAIGGIALAVWALNAAMNANPVVRVATGLILLGAALVTAYQKVKWFRDGVDAVWAWMKGTVPELKAIWGTVSKAISDAFQAALPVVQSVAHGIEDAVGWVIDAFNNVVGWVRKAVKDTTTEVNKWKVAFAVIHTIVDIVKAVFPVVWVVVKTYLGLIWGTIKAIMGQVANAFRTAWDVVKAIFSGAFKALKGIVEGFGQAIHGVIMIVGGVLKGDFGQIWDGVKEIFRGAKTALVAVLKGFTSAFVGVIKAIGAGIGRAFTGAFDSAKTLVVGFVNDIIDIINKIPFIPGTIAKIDAPRTQAQSSLGQNMVEGHARGGAFGKTGGLVNRPIVLMGEEAPTHPEFVIPTNPAYRKRARGLVGQAASAVGFAKGGILGKLVNDAGGLVTGATSKILGALPKNPLTGPLKGLGSAVLQKAGTFIKDKVASIASVVTGGGGSGTIRGGNIGGAKGWPTSPHGKVIGVPYSGTHTLGNWMSDNALDISVPMGSAVLAVEPGTITRVGGSWGGGASRFDGLTAYLNNEVFYTHMKGRAVRAGQKVHTGDIIGESGAANGVPHLHIGYKPPMKPPGYAMGGIFGMAAGGVNGDKKKRRRYVDALLSPVFRDPTDPASRTSAEQRKRERVAAARRRQAGVGSKVLGLARGGTVPARVRTAIEAARKAGFKGRDLVNMIAIAGRESRYNPNAQNLTPPDHSIGLWQINQLAHKGRYGSDAELKNPETNAKAAWALFQSSGLTPWAHAGGPLGGTDVAAARRAVIATRGAGGGTGGASAGGGSTATKVTQLESRQAALGLKAAELQRRVGGDITSPDTFANTRFARAGKGYDLANANKAAAILKKQQQAIGARIKAIRKGLGRKGITSGTKVRLQTELAQLIPQHAELGQQRKAILHPVGSPPVDTGTGGGDTSDPNEALIKAIEAAAEQQRVLEEAMKAHTDALTAVAGEVKRQTDFGQAVMTTENFQLKKMIADVVGAGLGASVNQQSFMPGYGQIASY